jgi:hypothetical protein
MRFDDLTLLIPEKYDAERAAVAAAWEGAGGSVLALGRFWEPPALDPARVRCYGNDTFCLVVAQKLGLELVSPPDDYLALLPPSLLKRRLVFIPLETALAGPFPSFVKPAIPKQFGARVFRTSAELVEETRGLPPETTVILAEVLEIEAEVRSFVLDGALQAFSVYEGQASDELVRGWIDVQRRPGQRADGDRLGLYPRSRMGCTGGECCLGGGSQRLRRRRGPAVYRASDPLSLMPAPPSP